MPTIYHITTRSSWEAAKKKGYYESPSLAEEGYIHCSLDQQIQGVLERYFKGKTDLVKLVIDTDKLTSQFIYDWSMSVADTFPHVYGPINIDAVTDVKPV
ncbi:MAG: DUF952 domain-containing protein [Chitinophagaceae bacterium]|nr:DUF952 domain-containing protein [Chitinophagaceae bacterium]